MLTFPETVSPGMSGVTAFDTTICEAMAEGIEVVARVAAFRADHVDPVEAQRRPVVRRAAQADVARLALVAFDGDARQTAGGLGDVLVGQAADGVGRGHGNQRIRILLNLQRGGLQFGDGARSGDDNGVSCIGIGIRLLGCLRRGQREHAGYRTEQNGAEFEDRRVAGLGDHGGGPLVELVSKGT